MGPLLVLVGPTAAGKSDLAWSLSRGAPLALVSADSQLVYRGLDLGTAKPPADQRPAWALIDVVDPGEGFSAGEFCRRAAAVCREAWTAGRVPLLCGGTGLYLKALLEGLAEVPPIPTALREGLEREWREGGLAPLVARLEASDPALAARLDRSNPRRVLRALEVRAATGQGLGEWQARTTRPSLEPSRVLWLGLDPGVEELDQRMERRLDACLAAGWADEAEALARIHGPARVAACGAIGYAELLEAAAGRISAGEARAAILTRTRRYARRQRTWFRALPGVVWSADPGALAARAREFLDTL